MCMACTQARPELVRQLHTRLSDEGARGLHGATVLFGMGGTGKSTVVCSLVREPTTRETFDRLCWLPVGQVRAPAFHDLP